MVRGTAKNTIVLIFSRFFMRGLQAATFVILAKVLSPQNMGIYGVVSSIILLVTQFGNLGLRQSAAFVIGSKKEAPGVVAGTLLSVLPVISLVCVAICLFAVFHQVGAVGMLVNLSVAACVISVVTITLMQGIMLGRGEIKSYGATDAAPRLVYFLIVAVAALAMTVDFPIAITTYSASFALVVPFAIWLALKGIKVGKPNMASIPPMLKYGLLISASSVIVTLNTRFGIFVINGKSDLAEAGQFFAYLRVVEITLEVASSVGLVMFSRAVGAGNAKNSLKEAAEVAAHMWWVGLLVSVIGVLFLPSLLVKLLGSSYTGSEGLIAVLLFAIAPASAVKILSNVYAALGKPYLIGLIALLGLAANGTFSVLLYPAFGARGIAASLCISYTLIYLGYSLVGRIAYGVPLRTFWAFSPQLLSKLAKKLKGRKSSSKRD